MFATGVQYVSVGRVGSGAVSTSEQAKGQTHHSKCLTLTHSQNHRTFSLSRSGGSHLPLSLCSDIPGAMDRMVRTPPLSFSASLYKFLHTHTFPCLYRVHTQCMASSMESTDRPVSESLVCPARAHRHIHTLFIQ